MAMLTWHDIPPAVRPSQHRSGHALPIELAGSCRPIREASPGPCPRTRHERRVQLPAAVVEGGGPPAEVRCQGVGVVPSEVGKAEALRD